MDIPQCLGCLFNIIRFLTSLIHNVKWMILMSHLFFQYLQFRMAEMATDLMASRLMVRHAAESLDHKTPDHVSQCAMAKLFVTEKCSEVCLSFLFKWICMVKCLIEKFFLEWVLSVASV